MFDYQSRITGVDNMLSYISDDKVIKFYILSFIHYILFAVPLYGMLICVKPGKFQWFLYTIFAIQLLFNIYDNGCFLMKLERKYVGKEWYGSYSLINNIVPNFTNPHSVNFIYWTTGIFFAILHPVMVYYFP